MREFKVYHATDSRIMIGEFEDIKKFNPDDYEHVATLELSDKLSSPYTFTKIFADTNHIEQEWWKNRSIKWYKESRSTSCGDVIYDQNMDEYFICCSIGWRKLNKE